MTLSTQFPRFYWETITDATDYGIGLPGEALEPGEANTAVPSVHRIAAVNNTRASTVSSQTPDRLQCCKE